MKVLASRVAHRLSEHAGASARLAVGATIDVEGFGPLVSREQAEAALADACWGNRTIARPTSGNGQTVEELAIINDLPGIAVRGELFVLYQTKLDVRDNSVRSAEALIRWQHPNHGLIMPDAFIALADESGDIVDVARWTLDRIMADQRRLRHAGHDLCMFMNISGRLLADRQFIDAACHAIAATGASIGFEITETSVIRDPETALANLQRCLDAGIRIAIDDYGSGLSSLSYLKRLPAHELKIDKQFILDLTNSHRDPLIVRSTIDLAHALDMVVTAEGVETPAALALLRVMGCDIVQGYLISVPEPIAALQHQLDYGAEALASLHGTQSLQQPSSFWKRAS